MKYSTAVAAIVAFVIPVVLSLPSTAFAREFKIPTCGAEACLADTNGTFYACAPSDLACLCSLDQDVIFQYTSTVQPCIDGDVGHATCTAGAIYQYKDLLTTVCAYEYFGSKAVEFPGT